MAKHVVVAVRPSMVDGARVYNYICLSVLLITDVDKYRACLHQRRSGGER